MYTSFYGINHTDVPMEKIEAIPEYKWSPAEVIQCMFRHVNDPEEALEYMATVDPFKFEVPPVDETPVDETPVDETPEDNEIPFDPAVDDLLLPESDGEDSERKYGTFLTAEIPSKNDGKYYKMVNTDTGPKYVPVENKTIPNDNEWKKYQDICIIKNDNDVGELYNN